VTHTYTQLSDWAHRSGDGLIPNQKKIPYAKSQTVDNKNCNLMPQILNPDRIL